MILVEYFLRRRDVFRVLRLHKPWKIEQPIEVAAYDTDFGAHAVHRLKALQFLFGRLPDIFGVVPRFQPLPIRRAVRRFSIAELLSDCLDLLAQVVVLLDLFHLLAHAHADLLLDLLDLQLARNDFVEPLKALSHINTREELLPRFELEAQMACD